MKKKTLSIFLCICCVMLFCVPALAATPDNILTYELSCDNGSVDVHDIQVSSGDTITVAYTITASARSVTATTQDQIIYDHKFFELVEGSIGKEDNYADAFTTSNPVDTDGTHFIYYNSTSNVTFAANKATKIGTFKLKVIATSGSSTITNNEYFATDKEAALFGAAKQDLKVTIGGVTPPVEKKATVPTAAENLVYTGNEQTGVAAGTGYTVEDGKATAAGNYTAVAKLSAGYTWADDSTGDKEIPWSIAQAEIDNATAASQVYAGSKLTPVLTIKAGSLTLASTDYDLGEWNGNLKDVGTYKATVTGKGNFKGSKEVTFEITAKGKVNVPTPEANLVYTGSEQEGVAAGTGYTVDNGKKTDAGDYTAKVTLDDGYTWSDGSKDAKEIAWSIAKAEIDSATAASQVYTGIVLTPVLTVKAGSLDATYDIGAWSGELKKVGTYTATVTGKGNFTGEKTVAFEITPMGTINVPTPEANLVYTASEQEGVTAGTGYTVTNGKATAAGSYKAVAQLKDGYKWSDGTTADKEISWSIGRAPITSVTAASQEFTGSKLTPVVEAKAGDLNATFEVGSWSGDLTAPGTYTANVTGTENFTGTKTVTFIITHEHSDGELQEGLEPGEHKPGYNQYYKCRCGKFFEDENCTEAINNLDAWKAQGGNGYIAPLHEIIKQEGLPAQKGKAGFKDYYKCTECDEFFEDVECTKRIIDLDAWKAQGGNGYIAPLNAEDTDKGTKTGDSDNIVLWLSFMILAIGGIGCSEFIKRKND